MSLWESADRTRTRLENNLIGFKAQYLAASNDLALARRERQFVRWWEKRVLSCLDDLWKAQKMLTTSPVSRPNSEAPGK